MARGGPLTSSAAVLLFAALAALLYTAELPRAVVVWGIWRPRAKTAISNAADFRVIADTVHCEDVQYHESSNLLFTACEGTEATRFAWFPPLARFGDPTAALKAQGALEVVDPATMTAKRLKFTNFNGPFVTHGIDVLDDPDKPTGEAVYIFAVNHVPSPAYAEDKNTKEHKARSIIEVFHYVIGSDSVEHVRSVWHPLIKTPNDVLALSPTSFFVSNDHYFRQGLLRSVEMLYFGAKWTDVIHVNFDELADGAFRNDDHLVTASVAVGGIHNTNGLAFGRTHTEVVIAGSESGRLHLGQVSQTEDSKGHRSIFVTDTIDFDSVLDNPGWFHDPFAGHGGRGDASGLLVPGLPKALDLLSAIRDPQGSCGSIVWIARPVASNGTEGNSDGWEKKVLFEDDSSRLRTASAAALVAIDPQKEGGKKKAWLFVTGFLAKSMIAVKVDL